MWRRWARAGIGLIGGVFLGAGLCLHGQLATAHHMRDEVQGTFFLWRAVGQATFIFQDDVTKASLWMNEIPEDVLQHSDRAAWLLVLLGAAMVIGAPVFVRDAQPTRKPNRRSAG